MERLTGYDKDNIQPRIIGKIRRHYQTNPAFTPESAAKSSKAAMGLCKWVLAMESYDRVIKLVRPKQEALAESERELEVLMTGLRAKQAQLKEVEDDLQGLQDQFEAANQKKEGLEQQVVDTGKKLDRAQKLIESLGGERTRWRAAEEELSRK